MRLPVRGRRRARQLRAAAITVAQRTPDTLIVARQRAQPAAVTIARLTIGAWPLRGELVSHIDRFRQELEHATGSGDPEFLRAPLLQGFVRRAWRHRPRRRRRGAAAGR